MNCLFEQDPTFPFCGSAEDRAAFYSAKFSRSDDKSSGGPIRKPRRSKVVLKMQYSKQCKKILVTQFGHGQSCFLWKSIFSGFSIRLAAKV